MMRAYEVCGNGLSHAQNLAKLREGTISPASRQPS